MFKGLSGSDDVTETVRRVQLYPPVTSCTSVATLHRDYTTTIARKSVPHCCVFKAQSGGFRKILFYYCQGIGA